MCHKVKEQNQGVEDMNEARVLNDIEEDIIQNTIEYGDTKVEDVMVKARTLSFS